MSARGLTMSVVAIAVAVGTYYGLETAYPPAAAKVAGSGNGGDVARVFAGSLTEPSPGMAESAAPAGDQGPSGMDLAATDESLTADEAMSDEAPVDPMADARMDMADPSQPVDEPIDEPVYEPEPAAEVATAAPEPVETPEPTPAPATPAPVTPAPAPAAPAATRAPSQPAKAPQKLTQWWGPASDVQLSIVYAGSAAYTRAIVLMFNGAFDDAASANQNVRVTDAAGKAVKGEWQIGANNKRMLLFPVAKAGTYTVAVKADLADRGGRKLGKAQSGPVRVQ